MLYIKMDVIRGLKTWRLSWIIHVDVLYKGEAGWPVSEEAGVMPEAGVVAR